MMAYLRKIAPQEAESLMRRTAEMRAKIQKDVEKSAKITTTAPLTCASFAVNTPVDSESPANSHF